MVAAALGTVVGTGSAPAHAQEAPTDILVGYRPDAPPRAVVALEGAVGVTKVGEVAALDVRVVRPGSGRSTAAAISGLRSSPLVAYAEPNLQYQATATTNDPSASKQWALNKVRASSAWDVTTGSPTTIVAVLDTGVDAAHPDLAGKVVKSVNFTTSATTADVVGHGTHVAGIAAAATNNGTGVAGIGYQTSIQNVKVLGDDGYGSWSSIANGITWAADNGARVVNLSLGGSTGSSTVEAAINYAWNKGVVVVAAAGNSSSSTPQYPAVYQNVIAVAASDPWDALASFSSFGSWVDVTAPGANIYSTLPGAAYGYMNGTSMASPQVAGLAALVQPLANDANGNGQVNDEVRACIESTAVPLPTAGTGTGRIDALGAVTCAAGTTAPPPAPTTGAVAGTVTDSTTGAAIANASVTAGGIGTVTNAAGAYTIAGLAEGTYTIAVTATGYTAASKSAGVTAGTTTTANVALQPQDGTPPSVSITSPSGGATVSGSTSVAVGATDAGGVSKVDVYVDGTLAGSSTSAPYAVAWDTTKAANGTHSLVAKATDAAGNVGTSAAVSVTVSNTTTTTVTETFSGNLGGRNQPTSATHQFSVATAGPMSAAMTWNGKKASLSFSVYSSTGTVLTTGIVSSSGKSTAAVALPAGTYRVVVSVLSGSSSYTLSVTHT